LAKQFFFPLLIGGVITVKNGFRHAARTFIPGGVFSRLAWMGETCGSKSSQLSQENGFKKYFTKLDENCPLNARTISRMLHSESHEILF